MTNVRIEVCSLVRNDLERGVARHVAYTSAALAYDLHPRTVRKWWARVERARREDWPALLNPSARRRPPRPIDERAWRSLLVQYLDFRAPSVREVYEKTQLLCTVFGFDPLPSISVVQRRLWNLPTHVVTLARKGILGLRASVPHEKREELRRDAERYLADLRNGHERGAA